jgi:hypothetical protein
MGNTSSNQINIRYDPGNTILYGCINSGLGNQLFQIANAYAYSREFKKKLKLSKTWKDKKTSRPDYWSTLFKESKLLKYVSEDKYNFDKVYNEPYFSYKNIIGYNGNLMLKGYFQSEKYFLKYEKKIRELFTLPNDLQEFATKNIIELKGDSNIPLVAVHVRRGDYVKSPKHIVLDISYYQESKKYIEEKLGLIPRYVYFTDDPLYVKINFSMKSNDIVFSGKSLKDYEEFAVMQKCDHFIIANSTFSWWAAWLSKDSSGESGEPKRPEDPKLVTAPYTWFNSPVYGSLDSWKDIYSISQNWKVIGKKESKPLSETFFMGLITCNKYKDRVQKQDLKSKKLPFEYRYFIGDPSLTEALENKEEKTVYLPCPDNYESLPKKVYHMLQWISINRPSVEYIAKVDDDVSFNILKFITYMNFIVGNKYDYSGIKVDIRKPAQGKCHLGRTEDKILGTKVIDIPKCQYCAGPAYVLSKKCVNIILEDLFKPETKSTIYEDQSIGHCLNMRGIYPTHVKVKNNACFWK